MFYCLEGKEDTWEEAKKDLANVDFIKTLSVRCEILFLFSMEYLFLEISER